MLPREVGRRRKKQVNGEGWGKEEIGQSKAIAARAVSRKLRAGETELWCEHLGCQVGKKNERQQREREGEEGERKKETERERDREKKRESEREQGSDREGRGRERQE